jgi:hypothetical protein
MSEEIASDEVASPCIGVCRLDPAGVCAGCLRTGQEIGRWRDAETTERREILRAVERRRAGRLAAAPPTRNSLPLPVGES